MFHYVLVAHGAAWVPQGWLFSSSPILLCPSRGHGLELLGYPTPRQFEPACADGRRLRLRGGDSVYRPQTIGLLTGMAVSVNWRVLGLGRRLAVAILTSRGRLKL